VSFIEFGIDDRGVATLTLNRPEVRNAFNAELIEEITLAVGSISEKARVLIIRGAGPVFCTGADLQWMRSMAGFSREENLADSSALQRMFRALDDCRVPVVGRIHGAAVAGATGLVACCDYAVAAESTLFAIAEVRLGLVPAVISPYVTRKVGYSFARAMFLSAERFDANRALAAGLIHRVVPDKELDAAVDEVVGWMLDAGPQAIIAARDLVEAVWNHRPEDVADLTVETIAERRVSEEGQEGVSAFLEKRKPRWADSS
jgi:methylglutaconyl-CoA hydratase